MKSFQPTQPKNRAEALACIGSVLGKKPPTLDERIAFATHGEFTQVRAFALTNSWPLKNGHIGWTLGDTLSEFLDQFDIAR